jgi:hypothetical protein
LVPSFDGGDDFVWVFGPGKGLGVGVGLSEVSVDRELEVLERSKHAALEALLGELGDDDTDLRGSSVAWLSNRLRTKPTTTAPVANRSGLRRAKLSALAIMSSKP